MVSNNSGNEINEDEVIGRPYFAANDSDRRNDWLSPINRRRLNNFRANRRGYWSLWLFVTLFVISLLAEVIANDKPLLVSYKGELLFPVFVDYPEEKFGGFLATTDYRDEFIQAEINNNGWIVWPPIRYSYSTINRSLSLPSPAPPSWMLSKEQRCAGMTKGVDDPNCTIGNWNWLGTDDQARDVMARLIYGFRLSILFAIIYTLGASVIGIISGGIQGYFGGKTDIVFQRVIEVWNSVPELYLIIIISAVLAPGFWILVAILLFFGWTQLVGYVRAEFLRARNFEYVRAARALGVGNIVIMWRHILPNAMIAAITTLPFIFTGAVTLLTALDYLGFGLPPGSPSLGELLRQGRNNLHAPWLTFTAFVSISIMLSLVVFIGEAVRDGIDPRKTFGED